MTLIELKERGIELHKTCRDRLEEYGNAYNAIYKACVDYAGPKMSDQILISDRAHEYAEKEKILYDLTKNEKHLMHIKAASELYVKNRVSFDDIHLILDKYKRELTFEEACDILREEENYNNMAPSTVIDVLHFIELNLRTG